MAMSPIDEMRMNRCRLYGRHWLMPEDHAGIYLIAMNEKGEQIKTDIAELTRESLMVLHNEAGRLLGLART